MTGTGFLLLALTLVVAAVDWIAVHQERRPLEYLAKPLTMGLLIGAALAFDVDDSTMQGFFVAALALSLVGDVFLMLPRDLFVQGLGSFLLAHIAYIVGLHVHGVEPIAFFAGIIAAMAVLIVIGRRVHVGVQRSEPALGGPVVAYMFVIAAMLASAIGTANVAAAIGATLFVSSDALIAWTRFIEAKPWGRVAIMITYHLGQIGLALSLL